MRLVLWLLAGYHLVAGAAALLLPATARRGVRALYGAVLPEDDAVRYMISVTGALALAFGVLIAAAALAPAEHRDIIGALLVLQLGRAYCRLRDRRLLATALRVTARSNGAAILMLVAECLVLGTWLR